MPGRETLKVSSVSFRPPPEPLRKKNTPSPALPLQTLTFRNFLHSARSFAGHRRSRPLASEKPLPLAFAKLFRSLTSVVERRKTRLVMTFLFPGSKVIDASYYPFDSCQKSNSERKLARPIRIFKSHSCCSQGNEESQVKHSPRPKRFGNLFSNSPPAGLEPSKECSPMDFEAHLPTGQVGLI